MFKRKFQSGTSSIRDFFGPRSRIAVLSLLVVVPYMLERVWTLEASRSSEITRASTELLYTAKHSADAQREVISSVEALLRSAAYIRAVSNNPRDCSMVRDSFYVEMPWISNFAIADNDGRIQCSTNRQYVGLNFSDRAYFEEALDKRRFVLSETVFNKLTNQPTVIASYAPSALPRSEAFVAMASINMQWLAQMLSRTERQAGVEILLIDKKGTILATRDNSFWLVGTRLDENALTTVTNAEPSGSTSLAGPNGVRQVISYANVTGTDMRMVARIDEARMLGQIDRDIRKAYLELALVSLLVMAAMAFFTELYAIRPLRELIKTVTRFGKGDLTIPVKPPAFLPPILQPLAKAFNDMADQLAEREQQLRAANNQLAVLASIDTVSGLANRRGFDSRLEFEWMKGEQTGDALGFLMIDVDFFKLFNDSYGHLEGDNCLRQVSDALSEVANRVNGFAGRYGGEEFTMLLPGVTSERALDVAELTRAGTEQLHIAHKASPNGRVTVSIGVAHACPPAGTPRDLMEAADAGLYAAKRRGRNTVVAHGAISMAEDVLALAS